MRCPRLGNVDTKSPHPLMDMHSGNRSEQHDDASHKRLARPFSTKRRRGAASGMLSSCRVCFNVKVEEFQIPNSDARYPITTLSRDRVCCHWSSFWRRACMQSQPPQQLATCSSSALWLRTRSGSLCAWNCLPLLAQITLLQGAQILNRWRDYFR